MDDSNLAESICRLRREKGWTQKQLADQLGVTDKAVSKWETGRSLPDPALLLPLGALLGISVDELLGGPAEGAPKASVADDRGIRIVAEYSTQILQSVRKRAKVIPAILAVVIIILAGVAVSAMINQPEPSSLDAIIGRGPMDALAAVKLTKEEQALLEFADLGAVGSRYYSYRLIGGKQVTEFGFYIYESGSWAKHPFVVESHSRIGLISLGASNGVIEVTCYNGESIARTSRSMAGDGGEFSIQTIQDGEGSVPIGTGTYMLPVIWAATLDESGMTGPSIPQAKEADWLAQGAPGEGIDAAVVLYIKVE